MTATTETSKTDVTTVIGSVPEGRKVHMAFRRDGKIFCQFTPTGPRIETEIAVLPDGGMDVWTVVFQAANDLLAGPALEGLRRHLKVDQVQFWRADQQAVVETLQELANAPQRLSALQDANADNRLAEIRRALREALRLTGDSTEDLGQLTRCVADTIHRLERENARLREQMKNQH